MYAGWCSAADSRNAPGAANWRLEQAEETLETAYYETSIWERWQLRLREGSWLAWVKQPTEAKPGLWSPGPPIPTLGSLCRYLGNR